MKIIQRQQLAFYDFDLKEHSTPLLQGAQERPKVIYA